MEKAIPFSGVWVYQGNLESFAHKEVLLEETGKEGGKQDREGKGDHAVRCLGAQMLIMSAVVHLQARSTSPWGLEDVNPWVPGDQFLRWCKMWL